MKEPEYVCKDINRIQNNLAELYEKCKNLPGFDVEEEHWDTIMACLLDLDTLRMKVEKLREWGHFHHRGKEIKADNKIKLVDYLRKNFFYGK